jgi:hypothetical protein
MSVDRTDYIMIAVNLPEELYDSEDFSDKYEKYIEGHPSVKPFTIVKDYMSGEYAVFGIIIVKSDSYDGLPMTYMNPYLEEKLVIVKQEAKKLFGLDLEPHFCAFSNFS